MKKVHFMGISGSGESAVAALAKAQGYEISGCDESDGGHSKTHVESIDLLCVSPSVFYLNSNHEEILAAKEKNIPVKTWQEFMGQELFKDKFTIAIAGTHGKTTTTGLVGILLEDAGLDPWVEVGGIVKNWKENFRVSKTDSKYFVCEADEFYDNFLNISADIIILNNIEFDHPEFFKEESKMFDSFVKFIQNCKPNAKLIVNADNNGIQKLLSFVGDDFYVVPKVGNGRDRSLQKEFGQTWKSVPTKLRKDIEIIKFDNSYIPQNQNIFNSLQIFGSQNISNAAGVLKFAETLQIPNEKVIAAFQKFQGIKRRQDLIGEIDGVKVFDDYAHHPTAIRETIKAFREKYQAEKLTVIIEPHTYSRLKFLFDNFKTCALNADLVIFTDVFASREKGHQTVSSAELVSEINQDKVKYIPFDEVVEFLENNVKSGIVIFMGAGKINKISKAYSGKLNFK